MRKYMTGVASMREAMGMAVHSKRLFGAHALSVVLR